MEDMPSFKYTFQQQPEDSIAVGRMRFRPGRWIQISAMIVLPLAALMTALWFRGWIDEDMLLAAFMVFVVLPAYVIGLLAVKHLFILPRKHRRIFRQNRGLQEPITVELSEESFAFNTCYGSGRIPWDHFYGCVANDRVIALCLSEIQYHVLPTRIFANENERCEVMELIARKIGRRPSRPGQTGG